jgi:5-methylcytosine-specific restriction protein A
MTRPTLIKRRLPDVSFVLGEEMPKRSYRFCKQAGCNELTRDASGYCAAHRAEGEQHKKEAESRYNRSRSNYTKAEHTYKWQQYSKRYLQDPDHQICRLHLKGCTLIADCVDHIVPPSGPDDPLFWDPGNHQPSCLHCNSVKGRKYIKGTYEL